MNENNKMNNSHGSQGNPQDCPFLFAHDGVNSNSKTGKDDIKSNDVISNEPKKCLFVELKDEASYLNLSSFYLVQFSYVCFFTLMDTLQPHLLEDEYNIHKDDEVKVNTDLVFYDNLYVMVFIYIFGAFQDVLGRKIVISLGFFIISIAFALYPFAGQIYPNLLILRLVFSNGICSVVTQPLLADYVKHTSKGFCGGISAFLSGCGALFAVFVLFRLREILNLQYVYIIGACISLFVCIFCAFAVKNVSHIKKYNSCGERW